MTYQNKDVYSGWWKYGKKEGKGTYIFASNGMKMVGNWSNGNFVTGKWVFPNGVYFEGNFQNNQPNGPGFIFGIYGNLGKWHMKGENIVEGTYTQTVAEGGEQLKKIRKAKRSQKLD